MDIDDSYPMVVTPAPSSPEDVQNKDLKLLWQGRLRSHRIDEDCLTRDYQNTTPWEESDISCQKVRFCGMIQDIGEVEYLPMDNDDDTVHASSSFVERQPIVVVTDWSDWKGDYESQKNIISQQHREKRVRREPQGIDRHSQTKLLVYVYYPSDEDGNTFVRNELRLHQLVEWIAVKEEDMNTGDMMVDMTLSTLNASSLGYTLSSESQFDWKLPRLHALRYCLRTMDQLQLNGMPSSPIMNSAEAILFVSETLHLPTSVATALWLTLLSRAEPNLPSASAPVTLGCASLHMVTPSDETAQRLVQMLTQLLQPAVPLLQTWTTSELVQHPQEQGTPVKRFAQRNGRIQRHPWQLPASSTILVHNNHVSTTNNTDWLMASLPELVQQQKMPLLCEGCQSVTLPADWRFIVVSSAATQARLTCTTTLDMSWWKPAGTTPSEASHARWARTLAALRVQTPKVDLPKSLLERAQDDFCRLRQQARDDARRQELPDGTAFHRWLTYTRLWARSRAASCASLADWKRALQLDQSLQQF